LKIYLHLDVTLTILIYKFLYVKKFIGKICYKCTTWIMVNASLDDEIFVMTFNIFSTLVSLIAFCETKSSVTKELFVKLLLFFFYTYYVGIAVIARWPASSISSELLLTIKTFDIRHNFHRNTTITDATQKYLDYFIIRFLSFYQINAIKVEKIVYYTRFIRGM
jgi:hypothetical protein